MDLTKLATRTFKEKIINEIKTGKELEVLFSALTLENNAPTIMEIFTKTKYNYIIVLKHEEVIGIMKLIDMGLTLVPRTTNVSIENIDKNTIDKIIGYPNLQKIVINSLVNDKNGVSRENMKTFVNGKFPTYVEDYFIDQMFMFGNFKSFVQYLWKNKDVISEEMKQAIMESTNHYNLSTHIVSSVITGTKTVEMPIEILNKY